MAIVSAAGHGTLTLAGKRLRAHQMFDRGMSFLGAAVLLRKHGGNDYVFLHLVCQALELMLKAVLLFADYDSFVKKLPPRSRQTPEGHGHNLVKLAKSACECYQRLKPLSAPLLSERAALNRLYQDQPLPLRYAGLHDFFIHPGSIKRDLVLRRTGAMAKLIQRELRREA
jgi:hypothetical protein